MQIQSGRTVPLSCAGRIANFRNMRKTAVNVVMNESVILLMLEARLIIIFDKKMFTAGIVHVRGLQKIKQSRQPCLKGILWPYFLAAFRSSITTELLT